MSVAKRGAAFTPPPVYYLHARSAVGTTRVGEADVVTLRRFVAHGVSLEVAFHGLLKTTTHHQLEAFRRVRLHPPSGGRGQTRKNRRTFIKQTNRLDRVDVVVGVARAQDALEQDFRLEHINGATMS